MLTGRKISRGLARNDGVAPIAALPNQRSQGDVISGVRCKHCSGEMPAEVLPEESHAKALDHRARQKTQADRHAVGNRLPNAAGP